MHRTHMHVTTNPPTPTQSQITRRISSHTTTKNMEIPPQNTPQHPQSNPRGMSPPPAQLQNHPDIITLLSPLGTHIPPLPTNHTEQTQWIETLATIGKIAKKEAYKITAKQAMFNIKTAIKKYRTLLNTKPKSIHKKIFQPTSENSLDCIQNSNGTILTNPADIAQEIYRTQQSSFQREAPNCDDAIDHPDTCMCAVRKYP